jgi:DNA polymerase I
MTSKGFPTNAIHGFTNFLLKFFKQHQPTHLAVALDAGRDTFRRQIFAGYKANRRTPPVNLIPQLPYIRRILDALNLPWFEHPGYEADDLIGTVCETMRREDCALVVVSSDKDLMQLVTDNVRLFDSAKDRWIGALEVIAKFGVEPCRVTEVLGLMGDAVDNIPGVKGVGEKTAMALMRRFGSLENLFENLGNLDASGLRGVNRLRKILLEGKDTALRSRALATIKRDAPIEITLGQLKISGADRGKLRKLFVELEFSNLVELLDHGVELTHNLSATAPVPAVEDTVGFQLALFPWK